MDQKNKTKEKFIALLQNTIVQNTLNHHLTFTFIKTIFLGTKAEKRVVEVKSKDDGLILHIRLTPKEYNILFNGKEVN